MFEQGSFCHFWIKVPFPERHVVTDCREFIHYFTSVMPVEWYIFQILLQSNVLYQQQTRV